MKTITSDQLIKANACRKQVELFRDTFGASVEVTKALAISLGDKFDFDWAARNFLNVGAWLEYLEIREAARDELDKVRETSCKEYKKVIAIAHKKYAEVCAAAFAELYLARS